MRRLMAMLGVLALATAACGSDGDEEAQPPSPTTTTRSAEVAQYCAASLDLETAPTPDIDYDTLSEAREKEAVKEYFRTIVLPLVNRLKAGYRPPDIAGHLDTLAAVSESVGQTGDFRELEAPAAKTAKAEVHGYDMGNCGWATVDVTAADYVFQGMPATLKLGPTSFELRNTGQEYHEMVVMRKKPGVGLSFDEILNKSDKEHQDDVEEVTVAFAAPGDTHYGIGRLTAGEYAMVCSLRVGTMPGKGDGTGAPHFTRGMKTEFKVA